MFTRIMIPIDNSEVSPAILPYASSMARGLNIPVDMVYVLDPASPAEVNLEAEQLAGGYARGLEEQGVQCRVTVATGSNPAEEILRQAEQRGCDLIAIATHDRNLLGQAIKGSVTNEVLRSSPVPVLAITPDEHPERTRKLSSILAPLDGTPFAEAALPYVEHLARKMSLEVVAVRVLHYSDFYPPITSANMALDYRTAELNAQAGEAVEEEAIRYLQDVTVGLSSKGLQARWEVVRGPVSSAIANLSQELPENIIALASHGRSGLARWVLGSTAEELIRGSGDPVLVVPSAADEEEDGDQG